MTVKFPNAQYIDMSTADNAWEDRSLVPKGDSSRAGPVHPPIPGGQCPRFSQMEDHGRARGTEWSLEKSSTYTAFSRTVGTSNPEK